MIYRFLVHNDTHSGISVLLFLSLEPPLPIETGEIMMKENFQNRISVNYMSDCYIISLQLKIH